MKQDPAIVWVGMSGGRGGLNQAEMTQVRSALAGARRPVGARGRGEVRRAVTSERAERLAARKLADIKPCPADRGGPGLRSPWERYSKHG